MKENQKMEGLWRSAKKYILVAVVAILVYELLENLTAVLASISAFLSILKPVFIGIAITFVANMPMRFFEFVVFKKWKASKLKRIVCLILAMILVLGIIAGVAIIAVPKLIDSVKTLTENFDSYTKSLIQWGNNLWANLDLNESMKARVAASAENLLTGADKFLSSMVESALRVTVSIASMVFNILFATILSFYGLYNKEKFVRQLRKLICAIFSEKTAQRVLYVGTRTNNTLKRYLYGLLLECTILGTICFLGMELIGFPFALLISVLVGVMQLLPIIGAWIGGIVGGLIILMVNPPMAIWFLVFLISAQLIEGNLIYPRVVGNAVGISGVWVLVAILLGGGLFGFIGILLAVPIMAVLYTLLQEWVNKRLAGKNVPLS